MSKVSNIESLLREIKTTEDEKTTDFLERFNIKDRTKIGDEYEGIAKKIFDKSLPGGLFCANGVQAKYFNGDLSHKIDLVVAKDQSLISFPNSANQVVACSDVYAAFEIKKTLTKKFLTEDVQKLTVFKNRVIEDVIGANKSESMMATHYARKLFESSVIRGLKANGREFDKARVTPLQADLYEQYKVQGYLPFTSCFGFNGSLSKDSFIEAFIKGVSGFRFAAWPDIVTCGDMSIVKLDERPYRSVYHFLGGEDVTDFCIGYGLFFSNSFSHYVEHIWEKFNTNFALSSNTYIFSDTVEKIAPVLALATLPKENVKLHFLKMDGDILLEYSDKESMLKMIFEITKDRSKK